MKKAQAKKPAGVGSPHQQAIEIVSAGYDMASVCTALAKQHPDLFVRLAAPSKRPTAVVMSPPPLLLNGQGHLQPKLPVQPPHWMHAVAIHLMSAQKVSAIKHLREHTGLGLKEAKDIVDAACSNEPISGRAQSEQYVEWLTQAARIRGVRV